MNIARKLTRLTVVIAVLLALPVYAQDEGALADQSAPDLTSLEPGWWTYFEGSKDVMQPRVEAYLADIDQLVAAVQAPNEPTARAALAAIRDNFNAYIALLDDDELQLIALPPPKISYTIDDLLRLAAVARGADEGAAQDQLDVEREQRILDGASRRRDIAFKNYVAESAMGDDRLIAALRLVQTRSAQAIATQRLQLLTQSFERARAYSDVTSERVVVASESLMTVTDDTGTGLDELRGRVVTGEAAIAVAQESLREAELAAAGLDLETAQGRSQQRLAQEKLVEAQVTQALAEVSLSKARARLAWTQLHLGNAPNVNVLVAQSSQWSELIADIADSLPQWQRESEDELLAVQIIGRDTLDRASRRLLDQRIGTAQITLARISELEASVADLVLLGEAVDGAAAQYTGALNSWLRSAGRQLKKGVVSVAHLSDVTLFSIGETPVTGRDILRVLVILLVAFFLSRGVRFAIKRFSDRDSSGTQASLYTVGRLSHYAIIITAVFVALSSIGLDFSNLALVAGALSVGIGFGLQSIVSNFVSGLIILFEHTLRVGDYVELDAGLTGTVKAINVRSTLINTNDNIDIVVPNSEFVTARLTNWTLGERILRVRIPFGVGYGSDKDTVRTAALEAAAEVSYTLTNMKGRDPDVWLVEFGDSSLNFLLTVWVNRQGARRPTRTRAAYLWALETKLTEYGIEIPFPQRDLNIRSGWPLPPTRPQAPPETSEDKPA